MKKCLLSLVVLVLALAVQAGYAAVRIDLSNPGAAPIPVAVVQFTGKTAEEQQYAKDLPGVIINNFSHSTPFKVLPEKAYLQTPAEIASNGPKFADWKGIGADALLTGNIELIDNGAQIRVEYRLYDTQTEQQIVGRRYTVESRFWRHIAHRVSDDVYEQLTGEPGYFATRIVHIGQTGDGKNMQRKLCVMDQDGANYQCLTTGVDLVLTPRFNPNLQKIIYMSYASGAPRLYLLDMPTGKQTIIGDFEGLNSTPRFSPDGQHIAMTLTMGHEGNAEVYEMNLNTRSLKRLTYHSAIDTSPSYSPDGKYIVFNSDRGGVAALYIMDRDGANVRRLTFREGRYYAPAWSPRGDLIAFVKQTGPVFHVGVIDPQGDEERLLTDSYLDDNVTWAPNGRVLVFQRQAPKSNKSKVYTIDLTGYNLRELTTPTDASDPAWSPLIK